MWDITKNGVVEKLINFKCNNIGMIDFIRKLKIKFALNMSRSKKEKNLNARSQADQTKILLHTHKIRKSEHHAKVIVKQS
jgi:hypothetical protein